MVIALTTVGYVFISGTVYLQLCKRGHLNGKGVFFWPLEHILPIKALQPQIHVASNVLATNEESSTLVRYPLNRVQWLFSRVISRVDPKVPFLENALRAVQCERLLELLASALHSIES